MTVFILNGFTQVGVVNKVKDSFVAQVGDKIKPFSFTDHQFPGLARRRACNWVREQVK